MSSTPKLRSLGDRIRQIALFEIGGLVLITPPFAWLSGVPLSESLGMLALLALIAAVWNGCYNTGFDWVEGRLTGRTADRRPFRLRCLHALGFETGLLILTLPVIMWWTGMGWLEALIADMAKLGFETLPSAANFIFTRHPKHDAATLAAALRERSIIVRHFKLPRIEQHLRITIGTDEQCMALLAALREIL